MSGYGNGATRRTHFSIVVLACVLCTPFFVLVTEASGAEETGADSPISLETIRDKPEPVAAFLENEEATMPDSLLFPRNLPEREWVDFEAEGFSTGVTGAVYRAGNPPTCGMPLGGIDTGCLDLDARGLLGYATVFNSFFPRRGPINLPFLGISVDHQTWVLTTLNLAWRDSVTYWDTPAKRVYKGVRLASEIHNWGHYPIADLEYVTDAPVEVALRAYSPFVPGDVAVSNTPGAVFEVHLRNTSDEAHKGSLAFSFPGPTEEESGTTRFTRRALDGALSGVAVESEQASYALGVIGEEESRFGGALGMDGEAWVRIEDKLPYAKEQCGASAAVDFSLEPGETKVVRFVLGWHSPVWMAGGGMTSGGNAFTHMYAGRFESAEAVARFLALNQESILRRIVAWQEVIYQDERTPSWLKDALINVLHLITETSVWAQAKPPVGAWCREEDGIFGMNESPRICPQMECIPCSFYGNLPLVYLFPELALSTLRAYKAYQFPDGAVPWTFCVETVGTSPYDMVTPSRGYAKKSQTTLNGACYAEMVDKMWLRTGDDAIVREFYESVKKNTIFTMNMRPGSGAAGVVSMPAGNDAYDWFEFCDLSGIVPHIGGVHLVQLRLARRMAEAMGDQEFARQCEEWLDEGGAVMEEHAWAGGHYMLFNELESGKQSDVVMAHQLDGEWMALFHGLEGVFRADRVATTLDTLKRTSLAMSDFGAVVFCKPEAKALEDDDWSPGYWGAHGVHPPGTFMLGMLYMYRGQREFGLDLIRRTVREVIQRGLYWDWPVVIDGALWNPLGADYYQNMILWSVIAALEGKDLTGPCEGGGLIDRILRAGKG